MGAPDGGIYGWCCLVRVIAWLRGRKHQGSHRSADGSGGRLERGRGARLVLNAKGHRFIGEGLDMEAQEGKGVSISDAGLVSGKGEWGFGLYESGYQVTLYFDHGGALTLDVQEGESGIQLSGWMKDMDQFILHREKSS